MTRMKIPILKHNSFNVLKISHSKKNNVFDPSYLQNLMFLDFYSMNQGMEVETMTQEQRRFLLNKIREGSARTKKSSKGKIFSSLNIIIHISQDQQPSYARTNPNPFKNHKHYQ